VGEYLKKAGGKQPQKLNKGTMCEMSPKTDTEVPQVKRYANIRYKEQIKIATTKRGKKGDIE
jgi:hypothetical protein